MAAIRDFALKRRSGERSALRICTKYPGYADGLNMLRAGIGVYCQTGRYGNKKSLDKVGKTERYSVGFDGLWFSRLSGIYGPTDSGKPSS